MTEEIIIAGFGGQGILSMGKIMAYSGVMQDMEVSWMPSYGPEMRGGTANVTVILSDEKISSPILRQFDTAIILNQQSLDKFEDSVKKGGILIYDSHGIVRHPERTDISLYCISAVEEAAKMNNPRTFNMNCSWCLSEDQTCSDSGKCCKGSGKITAGKIPLPHSG